LSIQPRRFSPIQSFAQLPNEFTFHEIQTVVIRTHDQDVLLAPAFAFDAVWVDVLCVLRPEGAAILEVADTFMSHLLRLDGPVQERQGIGFVVVDRGVTALGMARSSRPCLHCLCRSRAS
jgi:hypothetical protein